MFNRRSKPRTRDVFYRCVVGINVLAWSLLVVAFMVFHLARPDFIAGVQRYWGIAGNTQWSWPHLEVFFLLVQSALVMSLLTLLLSIRRNRRRNDDFGVNVYVLMGIGLVTLAVLVLSFI